MLAGNLEIECMSIGIKGTRIDTALSTLKEHIRMSDKYYHVLVLVLVLVVLRSIRGLLVSEPIKKY